MDQLRSLQPLRFGLLGLCLSALGCPPAEEATKPPEKKVGKAPQPQESPQVPTPAAKESAAPLRGASTPKEALASAAKDAEQKRWLSLFGRFTLPGRDEILLSPALSAASLEGLSGDEKLQKLLDGYGLTQKHMQATVNLEGSRRETTQVRLKPLASAQRAECYVKLMARFQDDDSALGGIVGHSYEWLITGRMGEPNVEGDTAKVSLIWMGQVRQLILKREEGSWLIDDWEKLY